MKNYSLTALFKLREHSKAVAENSLREAMHQHSLEKQKLTEIATCLRDTISARTKMQHNFFMKAQVSPCNKREVICHISSREKQLWDENSLRKSLANQEEMLKEAALKLELAKVSVIEAHRNLKVIEKHRAAWQHQKKRTEEIKEEYNSDDQNGVRFILKKV